MLRSVSLPSPLLLSSERQSRFRIPAPITSFTAAHLGPPSGSASGSVSAPQQRSFLTGLLYKASKSVLPPISATEQIALGAGTIGFDRDIFSGSPSLKTLTETYKIDEKRKTYLSEEVSLAGSCFSKVWMLRIRFMC